LEVTQQQVNALSASSISHSAAESTSAQGMIPKQRCVPMSATSSSTLEHLRADDQLAARANQMVDSLDRLQGNNHCVPSASTKRGWALPRGENAPRICTPWP
jgi:tRNA/tmRNA/rRNA uracil-C5-methylase (TrmA/RlmC/RlmD family)